MLDLFPVGCFILVPIDVCIISKLDDGFAGEDRRAAISVEGEEERAEDTAVQCACV